MVPPAIVNSVGVPINADAVAPGVKERISPTAGPITAVLTVGWGKDIAGIAESRADDIGEERQVVARVTLRFLNPEGDGEVDIVGELQVRPDAQRDIMRADVGFSAV